MPLHINESEVRSLLDMPAAIAAVEQISRKQSAGEAIVHSRRRIEFPGGGFFHYMSAADLAAGYVATKQYTFVKGRIRFLVLLYRMDTGEMAAMIEADALGQLRTGAASGVATKYLARPDAKVAAIIGTGGQARTQLAAVAAVRNLASARAYGRNPERRAKFCREMSAQLGIPVTEATSSAAALQDADIVCTATTSSQIVLHGADLPPGIHINAIGANHAHKRELDDSAVSRASVIFTDSIEQARQEAGDLILAFAGDDSRWSSVGELHQLVSGKVPGRQNNSQITLFKSNGLAVWDLAVAVHVYLRAKEKNLGRELPLWASEQGGGQ
jgi:ornithine cyclodeaminase/alanine dehydrogenase-like protein (mu-crystallin family)